MAKQDRVLDFIKVYPGRTFPELHEEIKGLYDPNDEKRDRKNLSVVLNQLKRAGKIIVKGKRSKYQYYDPAFSSFLASEEEGQCQEIAEEKLNDGDDELLLADVIEYAKKQGPDDEWDKALFESATKDKKVVEEKLNDLSVEKSGVSFQGQLITIVDLFIDSLEDFIFQQTKNAINPRLDDIFEKLKIRVIDHYRKEFDQRFLTMFGDIESQLRDSMAKAIQEEVKTEEPKDGSSKISVAVICKHQNIIDRVIESFDSHPNLDIRGWADDDGKNQLDSIAQNSDMIFFSTSFNSHQAMQVIKAKNPAAKIIWCNGGVTSIVSNIKTYLAVKEEN